MFESLFGLFIVLFIFFGISLVGWIRVLNEYERGVIFRLGRIQKDPVGPGLFILLFPPLIDRMVKIDMRTIAHNVPSQDVITRDNISIKVNAVIYYQVADPIKAVTSVFDYQQATSQMAQTTLRSILGQFEMDDMLASREKINNELQRIIDEQTEPWGVKVNTVELKDVDLPPDMQRAMAKQAEAERERRAKIISAEGEFQAAEKLTQAAEVMASQPMALQMRYLQTMVQVGAEKNTTIFFPVPIDLISSLMPKS